MREEPRPRVVRVLGRGEPAPRTRGPGLAVLAIAAYALAFFAALWLLRAGSPLFRRPSPPVSRSAAPAPKRVEPSRASLLEGEGLPPLAREEYLGRLATDCCDCGCEMTLQECLLSDRTCVRSREMADGLRQASAP